MFRTTMVTALAAGLAFAGPVLAQGFSAGGAAGVAAMQGATASPGYVGAAEGAAVDGAVASLRRGSTDGRRRAAPIDIDLPTGSDGWSAAPTRR